MKLAVIFNGQGAHYEKMGLDFVSEHKKAEEVFKTAEKASELPIREWIGEDFDKMKKTRYAQPAVSAVSLAVYESIKHLLPAVSYMAGLSLGEYSALMAGGMISLEEGFRLLKERGELMSRHCEVLEENFPVQMLAVIKVPFLEIESIVKELSETYEHLYIANMNSSSQTVLAGSKEAIKAFNQKSKEKGYKRGIPLKVEGPFHSPLMLSVSEPFSEALEEYEFSYSEVPIISNTTLTEHQPDSVKDVLVRHLTEPVHWKQTIDYFVEQGVTHIIQIGPGNTLAKLLEKKETSLECLVVDKVRDIDSIEPFLKRRE